MERLTERVNKGQKNKEYDLKKIKIYMGKCKIDVPFHTRHGTFHNMVVLLPIR